MLLFFLSAFLLNLKQCRIFVLISALTGYCLLLWCSLYGVMDPASGRFMIPESLFFANANDLGSQLVISLGSFLYLCTQRSMFFRLFGIVGFPITLLFMLKTGSRGSALACVAFTAVVFLYSRGAAKILVIAGITAALAVAVATIPSTALSRLVLIFLNPEKEVRSEEAYSRQQMHDISSQIARWELLKLSLWYTVTNPVFGVGPGVFMDRVAGDDAKKSRRSGWVGTHNSYTQVSSESGLPGAFCYIAVLWLTIRTARRLLAQSRDHPVLTEINKLAFALLAMAVTFSVSAFFHHVAYTGYLALLAGQVLALNRASQPLLEKNGRLLKPS
jgi:O-antigen ligase